MEPADNSKNEFAEAFVKLMAAADSRLMCPHSCHPDTDCPCNGALRVARATMASTQDTFMRSVSPVKN